MRGPRPSGGQRHTGKHRKNYGSAQLNSSGQILITLEETISLFDILSQMNLMFWYGVVS